jgi:hypothetical protein
MDIAKVIQKIRPNALFSINANSYDDLVWTDLKSDKPTLEEITSAWPEVENEITKERIEKKRKEEYQNISDPLFFEYQRGDATKDEWLKSIEAVKQKFPYPDLAQ